MSLSELAARTAKPKDKPYKLADAAGLYLYVSTSGTRLWRLDYSFQSKRKTLSLGQYPLLGLAAAREKRDDAKRLLLDGVDPGDAKKQIELSVLAAADAPTFEVVANEYLSRLKHDGCAERTYTKNEWLLTNLAADLSPKAIADITPADILSVLQHVEASGRLESARRLRSALSAVFRLGVVTLRCPNDPTIALIGATKAPKVTNRAAIVDEIHFGRLMRDIDEYDGWPTLKYAMQFTALSVARPGEVRLAEWPEFDLEAKRWIIPEERTKMRREHAVPLSDQAVAVLKNVSAISQGKRLVFPSIRSYDRPLSDAAMISALRRMGYEKHEQTAHGFRSSFSTIMNERGHDPEIIEHALAHVDSSVRAVYNRAKYYAPRAVLLQEWADIVDTLKKPGR